MSPKFAPLYDDLSFLSPLSNERARALRDFIAKHANGLVIDVGCGWATLLAQIVQKENAIHGLGIDVDANAIMHGQEVARKLGISDRLTLIAGDVAEHLPQEANGVLCIGASQIWGPAVHENLPIDYQSALLALRDIVRAGCPVVYGESIWTAAPTAESVKPLTGRFDEFVFLPELLDIVRECGFEVLRAHQATLDEWDSFESGYTAGYVRWLAENQNEHPDAPDVRARLLAQRNAYFKGYRGILGMAYLELLAI